MPWLATFMMNVLWLLLAIPGTLFIAYNTFLMPVLSFLFHLIHEGFLAFEDLFIRIQVGMFRDRQLLLFAIVLHCCLHCILRVLALVVDVWYSTSVMSLVGSFMSNMFYLSGILLVHVFVHRVVPE
jgi:hypothetical protein